MEFSKQLEIVEHLREIARTQGMDYFSVAPQHRWRGAPEQHRPRDLLPQCESVIVMGKKSPRGLWSQTLWHMIGASETGFWPT